MRERCRSGRSGRSRKPLYKQLYPGFESLSLRQIIYILNRWMNGASMKFFRVVSCFSLFKKNSSVTSFTDVLPPRVSHGCGNGSMTRTGKCRFRSSIICGYYWITATCSESDGIKLSSTERSRIVWQTEYRCRLFTSSLCAS